MLDISRLIKLNVELEGLLRVLNDRESDTARELLASKFEAYSQAMQEYLAESAAATPDNGHVEEQVVFVSSTNIEDVHDDMPVCFDDEAPIEMIGPTVVVGGDSPSEVVVNLDSHDDVAVPSEEPEYRTVISSASMDLPPITMTKRTHTPNSRLLRAFTLNDRFRFCRSLFSGDDADFTDTLKLLADMESYAEAHEYLTGDLLWDESDAEVADFLAIVAENMPNNEW